MLRIVTAFALVGLLPPPADDYEFVPDTSCWVQLSRGIRGYTSFGNLDAAGNFVPDPRYFNLHGPLSGMPMAKYLNSATTKDGRAYEYRSGALIRVKIDINSYQFVPELGSPVIDF